MYLILFQIHFTTSLKQKCNYFFNLTRQNFIYTIKYLIIKTNPLNNNFFLVFLTITLYFLRKKK